ncbi:hypothetical protein [Paractinoplanes globisporus]|uniref:YhhN-like protein n=1 Tax=Paractinoplanes globisporus TaxID=113565 RepID=A0ABW6W977_9ACTN|nr:hypothetical protein [Actinoplanes globisporus]
MNTESPPLIVGLSPVRTVLLLFAGIAAAALILLDGGATAPLSRILASAALIYAGSAALRTPRAAWPVFVLTCLVIAVTRFAGGNAVATWILLVLAVGVLTWAVLRHRSTGLALQWAAVAVFGLLAVGGLFGQGWAAGLVATGLLLHSVWDLAHLLRRRVVPGSMAAFCLALDATLGVAILVALGLD